MVDKETSNDNHSVPSGNALRGPDAHGQAAVLLVESLLHGLVARSLLQVTDAIEIVQIAAEVKEAVAGDMGDSPATMQKSLDILTTIEASLRIDQPTA